MRSRIGLLVTPLYLLGKSGVVLGQTPCNICGDGNIIGNPDGPIPNPTNPSQVATCSQFQFIASGDDNTIPPEFCPQIVQFIAQLNTCDCRAAGPPTLTPTAFPTRGDTPAPTFAPTSSPTPQPTSEPTPSPTPEPTFSPTPEPTFSPTPEPTPLPTFEPTPEPTQTPTSEEISSTPVPTQDRVISDTPATTQDRVTSDTPAPTEIEQLDLVSIAVGLPDFSILVAGLEAANLTGALIAPSPDYTVFAPTNSAFESLPSGILDALLLSENVGALSDVLLYHVLEGKFLAEDLSDGAQPRTLNGDAITISIGEVVSVNNATVIVPNVLASNGVIHIINEVLIPPGFSVTIPDLPDIVQTALQVGSFNFLVAALEFAGLVEALSEPNGPFTVFAPVDSAFTTLPAEVFAEILNDDIKALVTEVLLYHVVSGEIFSEDLDAGAVATTLQGNSVAAASVNGTAFVNGITVTTADVEASNGVIHVIDGVLAPPDLFSMLVDYLVGVSGNTTTPSA